MAKLSLRKPEGEHIMFQRVPEQLMRYKLEELEAAMAQNANTRVVLQQSGGSFGKTAETIFDESGGWYADTTVIDSVKRRVMVPRLNATGLQMLKSQLDMRISTFGLHEEEARGILEIHDRRVKQEKSRSR